VLLHVGSLQVRHLRDPKSLVEEEEGDEEIPSATRVSGADRAKQPADVVWSGTRCLPHRPIELGCADPAEGIPQRKPGRRLVEIGQVGEEPPPDCEFPGDRGRRETPGLEMRSPGERVLFRDDRKAQAETSREELREVAEIRGVHLARGRAGVMVDKAADPLVMHSSSTGDHRLDEAGMMIQSAIAWSIPPGD